MDTDSTPHCDALTRLDQPEMTPSHHKRIFIEYREPTDGCPCPILSVRDTGTGMDDQIIERYFLKVGRSYYNSTDFSIGDAHALVEYHR